MNSREAIAYNLINVRNLNMVSLTPIGKMSHSRKIHMNGVLPILMLAQIVFESYANLAE
jgi:hypothetical protein